MSSAKDHMANNGIKTPPDFLRPGGDKPLCPTAYSVSLVVAQLYSGLSCSLRNRVPIMRKALNSATMATGSCESFYEPHPSPTISYDPPRARAAAFVAARSSWLGGRSKTMGGRVGL